VSVLAIAWISFININGWWNKSNVADKVFVGSTDTRLTHVLHFYDSLRFVIIIRCDRGLGIVIATFLFSLGSSSNPMIHRTQVPNYHLTIEATTSENIGVLRIELNSSDFDWGL